MLRWVSANQKETSRLEFKQHIDLTIPARKAEFIRDVISLANSEGERPRDPAYLVVGFKDGKCVDVRGDHYDGATFGQVLDAHIFPALTIRYDEFSNRRGGRVGVLIISPDPNQLYMVRKKMMDAEGKGLLFPGQVWGRKADRKIALDGDQIIERLRDISHFATEAVLEPLRQRIADLEIQSGPILEVKRLRFEIEAERDWSKLEPLILKLFPYAREFDHPVKKEVISAVYEVTSRTRHGMTEGVADAVRSVLLELMPIGSGGFYHPSRTLLTGEEKEVLERVEHQAFCITWDACRYLRDAKVAKETLNKFCLIHKKRS